MISLPHHLPFVKVGENCTALIQSEWLEDIILNAAQGTRVPEFFATAIAGGIQNYLQNFEGSVIDSDQLINDIRRMLRRIGAHEIADNLEWIAPPLRISLTDLARKANHSFDWSFIQLLEEKSQEAVTSFADSVEYHGLESCVESLSKSHSKLSEAEIQKKIESKIDEYRFIGELSKPVYNVHIAR